ncbi:hypothetical protein GCM10010304_80210 [Streptomyces roseoviolaceus]
MGSGRDAHLSRTPAGGPPSQSLDDGPVQIPRHHRPIAASGNIGTAVGAENDHGRLAHRLGARLSPLKHRNLNLLGRYRFTASAPAAGALRPLRDPDAPELDDDGAE